MGKVFRVGVDNEGIATVTFDLQSEKVNKFSEIALHELRELVHELSANRDWRALIFQSAKKNIFIAGADIGEIKDIANSDEARAKAAAGQEILQHFSQLPFPSIAVIDGACLGGGLEFALACTYRIVTDNPKTQLGLPEVSLGIIPGFGGTQRLPRLIGLQRSLGVILTGKAVDGLTAYKIKLADLYVPQTYLDIKVKTFVQSILQTSGKNKVVARRKTRGVVNSILEKTKLGNKLVFKKTRESLLAKTRGKYPAPLAALAVVQKTFRTSFDAGLRIESEAFGELAPTRICKNLISLFFINEELKKEKGVPGDVASRELSTTGVLGAGVMGGGIAWLFSYRDLPVRMKDIGWDAIAKGYESAHGIYRQLLKRKKLKKNQVALKMHKISGALDFTGYNNVDIVLEAVVEDIDLKKKVLKELESHISDTAVIASNTSALSITEMATSLSSPERFIGMHFFNPVNRMPLVEIIPGEKTSPETIATVVAFTKRMGKTPVVVQNCAGFLVNRILLPYLNEAALLLQEGADIERVDKLIVDYGMPVGPFTLIDEVGIDVGYKVSRILEKAYGDRMNVAELLPVIYEENNLLGKKAGKGFFLHNGKKKQVNPQIADLVKHTRHTHSISTQLFSDEDITDRIILTMVNEAARCLEEKVVAKAAYLDMAMIMGTGFPPFKGGLLRYADERGLKIIVERLEACAARFGKRFTPAVLLNTMANQNETFY